MKVLSGAAEGRKLSLRQVLWLAMIVAMLASLLTVPSADAQQDSPLPTREQQQEAAADLMKQLDKFYGPVEFSDITIDPALGPPPWTSFVPDRDPAAAAAWVALANRLVRTPTADLRGLPLGVAVQDIENAFETGLNDSLETGQPVEGFGTDIGQQGIARIAGTLGADAPPPPPAPEPDCPSVEEDGSLADANITPFSPPDRSIVLCAGTIGDGAFGETSGDVDFFALEGVLEGDAILMDAVAFTPADVFAVALGLYGPDGALIATLNDTNDAAGPPLIVGAPVDGTYYAAVAGIDALPADPTDPASGSGVTFTGNYLMFTGVLPPVAPPPPGGPEPVPTPAPPAPPIAPFTARNYAAFDSAAAFAAIEAPCVSVEDDGSIPLANVLNLELDETIQCTGAIGDGPFGDTSGDFDYYAIDAFADETITVSVQSDELDSLIAIWGETGALFGFATDPESNNALLQFEAPLDGTYSVLVVNADSSPPNPFDSSSGLGVGSTGPYVVDFTRSSPAITDADVYLVDLDVGDTLGAGFTAPLGSRVLIVDPNGRLGQRSSGNASLAYPLANPLGHIGNVGAEFVVETSGIHQVIVTNGIGPYRGELRVKRAGLTDMPGDDVQTVFLDFDGASFNDEIFAFGAPIGGGVVRTLSPLAAFLPNWGLDAEDEDAVIESIIAEVTDDLLRDFHDSGLNGNRNATGNGGEIDLRILNSRDHEDPWGQPNVSRVIIGGTIEEAGIPTIGLAQSIDPGNFDTEETALMLLDLLSAPVGTNGVTLNQFLIAPPNTMIDLIGRAVGNITAHEIGHFIGNWHTVAGNDTPGIMDEGGDLPDTIGLGGDLVFGTVDDYDNDFGSDFFSFFEGFRGIENTAVRTAHALSTGAASVPTGEGLPADGTYSLINVRSGRFLDADGMNADGDMLVNTSAKQAADDEWELINIGDDLYNLRNVKFDTYLDADPNNDVDQSLRAVSDDRWKIIPVQSGSFYLFNVDRAGFLSEADRDVRLSKSETAAERWMLGAPTPVSEYAGTSITLRSGTTGRYLDADGNGDVNLSIFQRADDIWRVSDAGDGFVYLQNAVTNRYLHTAGGDADSTDEATADNVWSLTVVDELGDLEVRHVASGELLAGIRDGASYNAVTTETLQDVWTLAVLAEDA